MTTFLIIYGILTYALIGFIFMDWFNYHTFESCGEFNNTVTNIFVAVMWGVIAVLLVAVVVVYVLYVLCKKLFRKLFKKNKKTDTSETIDETYTDAPDDTDNEEVTDIDSSVEPVPDSSAE